MRHRWLWSAGILMALLPRCDVPAQTVAGALSAAMVTNGEVDATREAKGPGLIALVRAEHRRWRVDARFLHAALRANFSAQSDYDVDQIDLTGSWFWRPFLALQLGVSRRFVRPDFVAQEVGLVRVGVLSESRLARLAKVWIRGAYLPYTRFSGGGSAAPAFELGLGTAIGPEEARVGMFVEYEYQRIDRHAAADARIQFSSGQAGARLRF